MKSASCFFDTNILLYLLSSDYNKAEMAETLVSHGGAISVQVLNEFASVASRQLNMTYDEIREFLQTIRDVLSVQALTVETHELGLSIARRYGFSFYDSLILSAALLANCSRFYSEDMHHGLEIENKLVITNPFFD